MPKMVKLIALLLTVGGVFGIVVGLWTYIRVISQTGTRPSVSAVVLALLVIMFGWSIWVGIELWRERPEAYKWAKLLFALQIPNISMTAFSYQFYTGLMLCLSFSQQADSRLEVEFQLGSSLAFHVVPGTENLVLGVNLVAIGALLCLAMVSRQRATLPATSS